MENLFGNHEIIMMTHPSILISYPVKSLGNCCGGRVPALALPFIYVLIQNIHNAMLITKQFI